MKIAVPYENGMVFQHFGHTAEFKFYEVENGQVTASEVVSTNGQGHGALVGFLAQHNANVVFCGGIGPGAQNALAQAGIQLFGGISGPADAAVADYLAGKLRFDPNAHCDHHDHGEGHHCGEHHKTPERCITANVPGSFYALEEPAEARAVPRTLGLILTAFYWDTKEMLSVCFDAAGRGGSALVSICWNFRAAVFNGRWRS